MKIIHKITSISGFISGTFISIITIALIVEVVRRNAFNSPITGVNEICVFLYIAAVYFGFSFTQRQKGHITVDLVYDRLKPRTQGVLNKCVYVVNSLLFILFTSTNWMRAMEAYHKKELYYGGKTMPVYVLRFAIALGLTLMTIQILADTFEEFRKKDSTSAGAANGADGSMPEGGVK